MTAEEKIILSNLIDESIDLMQDYKNATAALTEESFDALLPYLTERNKLMFEIKGVIAKEDTIIAGCEEKDILTEIFRLRGLDKEYGGDVGELAKKLSSLKILYDITEKLEKEFELLMQYERADLADEFANLTKTKQVIDYIEQSASTGNFSSGALDQLL